MVSHKAVFFDRDGVLNRPIIRNKKPYAPRTLDKFHIYKDVKLSIQNLIKKNFLIFVVTNQPDIGNGLMCKKELDSMHQKLKSYIKVKKIYVCLHSQEENCICRKPNPFFILNAKTKYNISMPKSYFVGDRYSDMVASKKAKCKSIFIDRDYNETPPMNFVIRTKGIKEATNFILRNEK